MTHVRRKRQTCSHAATSISETRGRLLVLAPRQHGRNGDNTPIQITYVRFESTKKTEDEIVSSRWKNEQTGKTGQSTITAMVEWIASKKGTAYVDIGSNRVSVSVMHPQGVKPHLRTHADGEWTNNPLHLPTFE